MEEFSNQQSKNALESPTTGYGHHDEDADYSGTSPNKQSVHVGEFDPFGGDEQREVEPHNNKDHMNGHAQPDLLAFDPFSKDPYGGNPYESNQGYVMDMHSAAAQRTEEDGQSFQNHQSDLMTQSFTENNQNPFEISRTEQPPDIMSQSMHEDVDDLGLRASAQDEREPEASSPVDPADPYGGAMDRSYPGEVGYDNNNPEGFQAPELVQQLEEQVQQDGAERQEQDADHSLPDVVAETPSSPNQEMELTREEHLHDTDPVDREMEHGGPGGYHDDELNQTDEHQSRGFEAETPEDEVRVLVPDTDQRYDSFAPERVDPDERVLDTHEEISHGAAHDMQPTSAGPDRQVEDVGGSSEPEDDQSQGREQEEAKLVAHQQKQADDPAELSDQREDEDTEAIAEPARGQSGDVQHDVAMDHDTSQESVSFDPFGQQAAADVSGLPDDSFVTHRQTEHEADDEEGQGHDLTPKEDEWRRSEEVIPESPDLRPTSSPTESPEEERASSNTPAVQELMGNYAREKVQEISENAAATVSEVEQQQDPTQAVENDHYEHEIPEVPASPNTSATEYEEIQREALLDQNVVIEKDRSNEMWAEKQSLPEDSVVEKDTMETTKEDTLLSFTSADYAPAEEKSVPEIDENKQEALIEDVREMREQSPAAERYFAPADEPAPAEIPEPAPAEIPEPAPARTPDLASVPTPEPLASETEALVSTGQEPVEAPAAASATPAPAATDEKIENIPKPDEVKKGTALEKGKKTAVKTRDTKEDATKARLSPRKIPDLQKKELSTSSTTRTRTTVKTTMAGASTLKTKTTTTTRTVSSATSSTDKMAARKKPGEGAGNQSRTGMTTALTTTAPRASTRTTTTRSAPAARSTDAKPATTPASRTVGSTRATATARATPAAGATARKPPPSSSTASGALPSARASTQPRRAPASRGTQPTTEKERAATAAAVTARLSTSAKKTGSGSSSGSGSKGSPAKPASKPAGKVPPGAKTGEGAKITSKIGSMDNTKHKPGGGDKKVETKKLDWKAESKVGSMDNATHKPGGGEKKIGGTKLEWKASSKVGSMDNANHKAAGGDKKVESAKLEWKASSKVGSMDNARHKAAGGEKKIESQKVDFKNKAHSKVGSMDNTKHKAGGGEKKIENRKLDFKEKAHARTDHGATKNADAPATPPAGAEAPASPAADATPPTMTPQAADDSLAAPDQSPATTAEA